jgi:cytosine/adenosine deaminase-related metal-dependent hydrolase
MAVNAHTHLYSGLASLGMPAPEPAPTSFAEILERVWWRLDRALDASALRASARLYVAEALIAGTTALVDHHESPGCIDGSLDVVAAVCDELGMPALVCYGATERNGGRDEARRGLAECARFIRAARFSRVRGAIGLHAPFTVGDDTIRDAAALARELGAVLHVHVAEDAIDADDARARGHAGVIDRLATLGALIPGSIFAHGVHLSEGEVARCAAAGIWFVHNPRSNRGNRVGYAHALAASARVALGTDGHPADMRAEARAGEDAARAAGDDPAAIAAQLAAGDALARACRVPPLSGPELARAQRRAEAAIDQIRAEARAAAAQLWPRMAAL